MQLQPEVDCLPSKEQRAAMAADGDALTSKEMRFGARLAHTEKVVRDKAVANLSAFLASREEMSELELLKIWKGLFYCMWMCPKMAVQVNTFLYFYFL